MLAKRVEDRYSSVAAFAADLKLFLRSSRSTIDQESGSIFDLPFVVGNAGPLPSTVTNVQSAIAKPGIQKTRSRRRVVPATVGNLVPFVLSAIAAMTTA